MKTFISRRVYFSFHQQNKWNFRIPPFPPTFIIQDNENQRMWGKFSNTSFSSKFTKSEVSRGSGKNYFKYSIPRCGNSLSSGARESSSPGSWTPIQSQLISKWVDLFWFQCNLFLIQRNLFSTVICLTSDFIWYDISQFLFRTVYIINYF